MPIQISYLADHPEWIAKVAEWFEEEWGSVWKPRTFNGWWDIAANHSNHSRLPIAYVAHKNGRIFGAAALDPHPPIPLLDEFAGAWMSGLFLERDPYEEYHKALMVQKICETALSFDHLKIHTIARVADQRFNYEGHGWEQVGTVEMAACQVRVLQMIVR
ncbi:MAG: hypothetical protein AAFX93_02740 [Verrucomicrobiota bacterium]